MARFVPFLADPTPVTPPQPPPGGGGGPPTGTSGPRYPPIRWPAEALWENISHSWLGPNGLVWELSSPTSPVILTRAGIRGMTDAPVREYVDESPAIDGARFRGYVYDPRPVHWNVAMFVDTGSADWLRLHSNFKRSFKRGTAGIWQIDHPALGRRQLACHYRGDSDRTLDKDVAFFGWDVFAVDMIAYQPYWMGEPVVRTFRGLTPVDFVGQVGGQRLGPPFYPSSSSSTAGADLTNPGDADSYVVWTATGPFTEATVGVGADEIVLPFALAAGRYVVVDPNPEHQTAIEYLADGTFVAERTGALASSTPWESSRVPATGRPVQLAVNIEGTGSITAELTPLYEHALAMANA